MDKELIIIAEAGVNHNGDIDLAKQLIEVAANAGADYVKFQTFTADEIVTPEADKAAYQKKTTQASESQYEMLKRLEIDESSHKALMDHCTANDIGFLSTPFDIPSVDLLDDLGLEVIKIPSGEITNLPYLNHVAEKGKQVIMSTGMANLQEISEAVAILVAQGLHPSDITLLHCNTQYPTPFRDANLLAIRTLAEEFPECHVGYSDHTPSIECSVAAVALSASVIEKHFTLDKDMDGPDHKASLDPKELEALVHSVRNVHTALGNGDKRPSQSETPNIHIARKYLVAAHLINKGEPFTQENLAVRRIGKLGISPMKWDEVIGQIAKRDFQTMEAIEL